MSEPLQKSWEMEEDDKRAIEYWRRKYPDLTDEELLTIEFRFKQYAHLLAEILMSNQPDNNEES
jgi:hypothetical protein